MTTVKWYLGSSGSSLILLKLSETHKLPHLADALKRLAVHHYINTCVNVTLYYHNYRYKTLQKNLRRKHMYIH